jgi:Cd2+/Zn2+-exporting ATPase
MGEESAEGAFWAAVGAASILSLVLLAAGIEHGAYFVQIGIALSLALKFAYMLVAKRKFTVDLLMSVAIGISAFEGLYLESALISLLYSAAETVEHRVERYALKRIRALRSLLPASVKVRRNGSIANVMLDEVDRGDEVVVGYGEAVPVDGVLLSPRGVFDTSIVTGEATPVELRQGDPVEAGYVNVGEQVVVKAARRALESSLAVLVAEAERALESKSRVQRLVEKIAPWYTLAVLGAYAAVAAYVGTAAALPIILAGCPSAFIVSSAFATAYTVAALAAKGVVVRGGQVLESLDKVDVLVVDKTGTLTLGELRVASVEVLDGVDPAEALELAASAARVSKHPAARAIAASRGPPLAPRSVVEVPGRGILAEVDGRRIVLGSKELVEEAVGARLELRCAGMRAVYLAIDGKPAAAICLEEVPDRVSLEAVRKAASESGARIVIASGDAESRVKKIAELLEAEYYANLKPRDKSALVRELRRRGYKVAAVGDGVNDVDALAQADVGIAVGEISIVAKVADVVADSAGMLPAILRAARSYTKAIRRSFAVAGAVKATALAAGMLQLIPLWAVLGLGDDGSTLLAVAVAAATISRSLR